MSTYTMCSICSMLYLPVLWSSWPPRCPHCLSLGPRLSSLLFALMGSRTHHWNICRVRFFCPLVFLTIYSLLTIARAVHWNVALHSNLQSSPVFSLLMSEGNYKRSFFYTPTAWRANYMFGHPLIDHLYSHESPLAIGCVCMCVSLLPAGLF